MSTNLFDFQTKVLNTACEHLTDMRDAKKEVGQNSSLLIHMPCGMGKTVVLAALLRKELQNSVTLVVTPGKGGLAKQTHAVLARELKGAGRDVILLGEDAAPPPQPKRGTVIVTNYEKVIVKDNTTQEYKSKISRDGEVPNLWDTLEYLKNADIELVCVIDEAHYGSHTSIGRIGEFFAEVAQRYGSVPLRVEATATPKKRSPLGVELYTANATEYAGIKAGLLRKRVMLNSGRDELESVIIKEFQDGGEHELAGNQDAVLTELMVRKWKELSDTINALEDPAKKYSPLMLFSVSNGDKGKQEMKIIQQVLAKHAMTVLDGSVKIHMTDDALSFEEQQELRKTNSGVHALIFKQSIALGWDCPRAQLMMITREVSSKDTTFTDQLLGRVRRQVGGFSRESDIIDTAYVFSMCDAVTISAMSGSEVVDADSICPADADQLALWKSMHMRRTLITRKGRAGRRDGEDGTKDEGIVTKDITKLLKDGNVTGKLSGSVDASKYTVAVAGEQTIRVGGTVSLNMDLDAVYLDSLTRSLQERIKERFGDRKVSAKGKNAETAREPVVRWFAANCTDKDGNPLTDPVEAHILTDLDENGWTGTAGKVLTDLGDRVHKLEESKKRNDYVESAEPLPYAPVEKRHRPKDDLVASQRGHKLSKYAGELLRTHLYGTPVKSMNNATEQKFEDEFLFHLSKRENSPLDSWFRNEPRLDSFGKAFSLGYKVDGKFSTEQMFPDYMLLLRKVDGTYVPVAVEVKGTDEGNPTDRGNIKRLKGKAQRLSELTSDDPRYGSREDTVDDDGNVTRYGRGPTIGAMVYRNSGDWCVYGDGAQEEFSVWLKSHGVDL